MSRKPSSSRVEGALEHPVSYLETNKRLAERVSRERECHRQNQTSTKESRRRQCRKELRSHPSERGCHRLCQSNNARSHEGYDNSEITRHSIHLSRAFTSALQLASRAWPPPPYAEREGGNFFSYPKRRHRALFLGLRSAAYWAARRRSPIVYH